MNAFHYVYFFHVSLPCILVGGGQQLWMVAVYTLSAASCPAELLPWHGRKKEDCLEGSIGDCHSPADGWCHFQLIVIHSMEVHLVSITYKVDFHANHFNVVYLA